MVCDSPDSGLTSVAQRGEESTGSILNPNSHFYRFEKVFAAWGEAPGILSLKSLPGATWVHLQVHVVDLGLLAAVALEPKLEINFHDARLISHSAIG